MTMPRIMLIILILNLLITLGGVGANFWLLHSGAGISSSSAEAGQASKDGAEVAVSEYQFYAVNKIIVSVRGSDREHYFVLDLVLQAGKETETSQLQGVEAIVRNSAVAHLSAIPFDTLRQLSIGDLQASLETALRQDLATRSIVAPFSSLLVSKMLVQ